MVRMSEKLNRVISLDESKFFRVEKMVFFFVYVAPSALYMDLDLVMNFPRKTIEAGAQRHGPTLRWFEFVSFMEFKVPCAKRHTRELWKDCACAKVARICNCDMYFNKITTRSTLLRF